MTRKLLYLLLLLSVSAGALHAQLPGQVVDQIAVQVGDNIIMQSEIEFEFEQVKKQMDNPNDSMKCDILKQKIIEKIMVTKAQVDSVVVSEDHVDAELEKRIRYFAMQFANGRSLETGIKNMEEMYGKSIAQIKADYRDKIKNGLLAQEIQAKVLKDIKVAPTDIKKLYNQVAAADSLPFYSAEVEVAQLIIKPKVNKEARDIAKQKIMELRERVMNGDNFNTLALIYSDDKGSATNGGELGYIGRGSFVPEFEAAAFRLKPDTISRIIETKYGYHILKLIDRKGDNINVRHILIRPKIFKTDIALAKERIDSMVWQVKIDSLKFEDAAKKFSDDEMNRGNGGFITSDATGSTFIPIDELDKEIYYKIENLKAGEMTEPELITLPGPDREEAWRVLYLRAETKPHRANLRDDYQKFQAMALQQKQQKAVEKFIEKTKSNLYIKVYEPYTSCPGVNQYITK